MVFIVFLGKLYNMGKILQYVQVQECLSMYFYSMYKHGLLTISIKNLPVKNLCFSPFAECDLSDLFSFIVMAMYCFCCLYFFHLFEFAWQGFMKQS